MTSTVLPSQKGWAKDRKSNETPIPRPKGLGNSIYIFSIAPAFKPYKCPRHVGFSQTLALPISKNSKTSGVTVINYMPKSIF